jgi:hypothetical protein
MIKTKNYDDPRPSGMMWLCRCIDTDCKELFLGYKGDFICGECANKPEVNNENEENTEMVNEEMNK